MWKLGNGRIIRFWEDRWLLYKPLEDIPILKDWKDWFKNRYGGFVRDYWRNGKWTEFNQQCLGLKFLEILLSSKNLRGNKEDSLIWRETLDGNYSVSSTVAIHNKVLEEIPIWAKVWNKKLIPKVNIFFWIFIQNKVLTLDNLQKRGFVFPNRCSLCCKKEESACHILYQYTFNQEIWKIIFSRWKLSWVFPNSLGEFL